MLEQMSLHIINPHSRFYWYVHPANKLVVVIEWLKRDMAGRYPSIGGMIGQVILTRSTAGPVVDDFRDLRILFIQHCGTCAIMGFD